MPGLGLPPRSDSGVHTCLGWGYFRLLLYMPILKDHILLSLVFSRFQLNSKFKLMLQKLADEIIKYLAESSKMHFRKINEKVKFQSNFTKTSLFEKVKF